MKDSKSDLQHPRHQSISIWGTNLRDRHVHHQKTWWLTRDDIKINYHYDTAPVIARLALAKRGVIGQSRNAPTLLWIIQSPDQVRGWLDNDNREIIA